MTKRITLGILAHVDAGKTTLTESLLYLSGMIRQKGRVDHGDAFLDTEEMEKKRGITIFSKEARIKVQDMELTLVDTPGHVDFSAEMERVLQILDYAVLVISAADGVQQHTRTVFRLLKRHHIPVILFVNKMDLAGADKDTVMNRLQNELSADCMDFSPYLHEEKAGRKISEDLAVMSEEMMEHFLNDGTIPDDLIKDAISSRRFFPVLFGSALKMEGISDLLALLLRFTKTPLYESSFGARVFRVRHDDTGMRLTHLKITGGTLHVKDVLPNRGLNEKADQIRLYSGDTYKLTDSAPAGSICTVTGLSSALPGDVIGAGTKTFAPLLVPAMSAELILPENVSPQEFFRTVKILEDETPELGFVWNEKEQSVSVGLMGDVQTEILADRVMKRFGIPIRFKEAAISYRETIVKSVEGVGHFEPLRHYAEVHLLLEPGERGSGVRLYSAVNEDLLDISRQNQILKILSGREHPGVLTGSPLTDVRITLTAGKDHPKHTEGGDFRQAACRAVRQGLKRTECILLEPFAAYTLTVPTDTLGRALHDLTSLSADFEAPLPTGNMTVIKGRAPFITLNGYVSEVRAYTKGNGSLTFVTDGWDTCHNASEVIKARGYDSETDKENPTGSVFCSHGSGFIVPWDKVGDYMHLPYQAAEKGTEAAISENEGRSDEASGQKAGQSEDALFMEVYQREFGTNPSETDRARKKWKSHAQEAPKTAPQTRYDKHGQPIYPKKDNRKPYLIVDGYNIIHALPPLKDMLAAGLDAARMKLLEMLSSYQGYRDIKMTVVFDAYKTDRTPESITQYDNIEVVFTKKDETADAYIERTVHDLTDRYMITVATSDGLEQLTVMRLGALRMSAGMLDEDMKRAARGE